MEGFWLQCLCELRTHYLNFFPSILNLSCCCITSQLVGCITQTNYALGFFRYRTEILC